MIKMNEVKVGDILYECQSGFNIKFEVLSKPIPTTLEADSNKNMWAWEGRNVFSGEIINYALTEGFEHYGPRLYSEPQYCHFKDGEITFKFVGETEGYSTNDS